MMALMKQPVSLSFFSVPGVWLHADCSARALQVGRILDLEVKQ